MRLRKKLNTAKLRRALERSGTINGAAKVLGVGWGTVKVRLERCPELAEALAAGKRAAAAARRERIVQRLRQAEVNARRAEGEIEYSQRNMLEHYAELDVLAIREFEAQQRELASDARGYRREVRSAERSLRHFEAGLA